MKKEIYILTNKEEKEQYILDKLWDNEYPFFSSLNELKKFYAKNIQKIEHCEITKVTIKIERGIE